MATTGSADKAALLVVDVQVGVMADCWDAARITANVARAVAHARQSGLPLLWVQHEDEHLAPGSAAWRWVPELLPAAGETCLAKRFNSAFEATALADELARHDIGHLVLAGAASNWCIRATAYAALERGYDLTLLADAHSTGTLELPDGQRVEADAVIRDLNTVMRWLAYPGRRNQAVSVEEWSAGLAAPAQTS